MTLTCVEARQSLGYGGLLSTNRLINKESPCDSDIKPHDHY